jgi:signal peptidase II
VGAVRRVVKGELTPALLGALGILLLDQLSKAVVRAFLPIGHSFPPDTPIRLTHVTNTGAAFGLFQGSGTVLTVVALVGVVLLLLYYRSFGLRHPLLRVSLALQLGGALGNLTDRLRQGYVTDFIDLRVWPIFNLADSAITIGAFLLIAVALFSSQR